MGLGRVDPQNSNEPFCMTVLAFKLSRRANAVSSLHGVVRADIKSRLKLYGHNLAAARQTHDEGSDHLRSAQKDVRQTRSELRDYNWRRTYFWFADAGLPTVLFGLAVWASLDQIFMLHCLEIPLNCAGGETP